MSRILPSDVEAILDFDPSIPDLQPFIDAAEELVTEMCANAPVLPGGIAYSPGRLKIIETWLAAHFVAIRDPRYVSETMGAANVTYQSQVSLNLSLTPYGQQALTLDTKGGLAMLDRHISQGHRAQASITYLGTNIRRKLNEAYPWRFLGIGW